MSSPPKLDAKLVAQSLNYHGQQLQKIWESERGEDDLNTVGVPPLNFSTYQSRQKHLTFQDRGKRVMLHQFIAKEAPALFDASQLSDVPTSSASTVDAIPPDDSVSAVMPPFEVFLNVDSNARMRHFFQNIKTGELIIGTVINRNNTMMMLKVLFSLGPNPRYVADINVKACLYLTNTIPAVDKKNVSRNYLMNDTVCCEVLEVIPDTDKISVGMKGATRNPDDPPPKPPLGLISSDDLPLIYKKTLEMKGESYESILEKSPGFNNPNCISYLSDMLGLSSTHCTNLLSLRAGFPPSEYADELKQAQASKWAFKFVAEGIEHFKAGRHPEAFQCLNEALKIDERNVEGLVARGALYANSGTFKKAIADFETSLQINPNHANARKYMGETLVALGRSYEDENKFKEAQESYEACLNIIPFHEEAQSSLEFLKSKSNKPLIEPAELLLPSLTSSKPFEVKETLKQLLNLTEKKEKKSKKKKRGKGKKKHHRSSSSSSSSSDSSSSSSSSDSSSSSSDSSEGGRRKKKRRSRSSAKKQKSLSPLSKRMAMIEPSMDKSHNSQFNHPFGWQPGPGPQGDITAAPALSKQDFDYELKVRKFLDMSKEDSDYEEKVRNLLSEAEKYKRDRKMQDLATQEHEKSSKARKKAKKESKKSKKESKKKRKERERDERRKAKLAARSSNTTANASAEYLRDFDQNMGDKKFRDALRIELSQKPDEKKRKRDRSISAEDFERKHEDDKRILDGISDLEELENKLSAYYAKVEKDTTRSSNRQDNGERRPEKSFGRSRSASVDRDRDDKPKWKMQMNASKERSRKDYDDDPNKSYFQRSSSEGDREDRKTSPDDKNISVRRAMALKEPPPPLPPPIPKLMEPQPPLPDDIPRTKPNIVLDKFGNFRLAKEGEGENGLQDQRRVGRRTRSRSRGSSRRDKRSSRSRSRPRKYRSRSSGSSRSSSGSRGRPRRSRSAGSRSPRSRSDRSRSGRSRSRSRSGSRSRSRSGDRRMRRGGWRGRGGYDRGTYYKPRFQPYNNRGNGRGGRTDFRRDDRRFDWRDRGGRGGRGFRPRNRGGNRGRPFRGGYRDFRDRRGRYSRSRSPDRSRRSRSYTPQDDNRRNQDKDKMDRFSDREGHRSEGEYEEERYVDRKEYDGKWADNGEHGGGGGGAEEKNTEPPLSKDDE